MIPKIIHQIYWDFYGNDKEIPKKWKNYHNTWKKKFPEPEYKHFL
jgi:mannosyltransferase OCH1-like enzyme